MSRRKGNDEPRGKGSAKDDAAAERQRRYEDMQRKSREYEKQVDKAGTHDDTYDKRKQWGQS